MRRASGLPHGRLACVVVLLQRLARAPEREVTPGNVGGGEETGLEPFVVAAEAPTDRDRDVHHDHRRAVRVGIDVQQAFESYFEAAFLADLTDGRDGDRLPPIDVPAGEYPFTIARLNGALHEHDPLLL